MSSLPYDNIPLQENRQGAVPGAVPRRSTRRSTRRGGKATPLWNVMSYGMVRPLSQGGRVSVPSISALFFQEMPVSSFFFRYHPRTVTFPSFHPGPLLRRADFGVSSAPGDATVSPYPKNQAIFFINGPDTVSCPSVGPPASGFGERYPPG